MNRTTFLFVISIFWLLSGCSAGDGTADGAANDSSASDTADRAEGAAADATNAAVVQEEQPLHANFRLSEGELDSMTAGLPAEIRDTIAASPGEFLSMIEGVLAQPEELTWLVDKEHALAADYAPADLVDLDEVDGLTLRNTGLSLRRVIIAPLLDMVDAAGIEGIDLELSSTYRSYDYQRQVYQRWVNDLGQEQADRVSAQPGHSQHQLGTAIDFGCICLAFETQPAGRWLLRHAWRYGFSISYPTGYSDVTGYDYEPWHYRFIGIAASTLEHLFFDGVQQYMLEFLDANRHLLEQVHVPITS